MPSSSRPAPRPHGAAVGCDLHCQPLQGEGPDLDGPDFHNGPTHCVGLKPAALGSPVRVLLHDEEGNVTMGVLFAEPADTLLFNRTAGRDETNAADHAEGDPGAGLLDFFQRQWPHLDLECSDTPYEPDPLAVYDEEDDDEPDYYDEEEDDEDDEELEDDYEDDYDDEDEEEDEFEDDDEEEDEFEYDDED